MKNPFRFSSRVFSILTASVLTLASVPFMVSAENREENPADVLIGLINSERESMGMEPFTVVPYLSTYAEIRAEESVESFSHKRPDGSNFALGIDADEFLFTCIQECLYQGIEGPEAEFELLKSIPEYSEQIFSSSGNCIGAGSFRISENDEKSNWCILVADFAEEDGSEAPEITEKENLTDADVLLKLINEARNAEGLGGFTMNEELRKAADIRADEISCCFSHTRPDGSKFSTSIDTSKYHYKMLAENLACGYDLPSDTLLQFKSSKSHWANIMNETATDIGISVCYNPDSDYEYYWVLIFAAPANKMENEKTAVDNSSYSSDIVKLINKARGEKNAPALKVSEKLCKSASVRAGELNEYYGSRRPDGSVFATAVTEAGYDFNLTAECISRDAAEPYDFLELLSGSEKRVWENLLNEQYTEIGVGLTFRKSGEIENCVIHVAEPACENDASADNTETVSKGDVNCDNSTDIFDYIILSGAVKDGGCSLSENQISAADCSGDGKISVADALLLKRYIMGAIDKFPC